MTDKKDMTYEEKIAALKKMHAHWAPESRDQIDKWADEISRLRFEAQWIQHPNTKQLRTVLTSQLDRITTLLSTDETVKDDERRLLFRQKDIILSLLAVLTTDPEKELQVIGRELDVNL